MKAMDVRVGDRYEDTYRMVTFVITELRSCDACACGWGEIDLVETHPQVKRRAYTFKQFEALKYIKYVGSATTAELLWLRAPSDNIGSS